VTYIEDFLYLLIEKTCHYLLRESSCLTSGLFRRDHLTPGCTHLRIRSIENSSEETGFCFWVDQGCKENGNKMILMGRKTVIMIEMVRSLMTSHF